MVREHILYDFTPLKFVDACFMGQHMVCLPKFPCAVAKYVHSAVVRYSVPMSISQSAISYGKGGGEMVLPVLSVTERATLKSPITMYLCNSPFSLINFCCIFKAVLLDAYKFRAVLSS